MVVLAMDRGVWISFSYRTSPRSGSYKMAEAEETPKGSAADCQPGTAVISSTHTDIHVPNFFQCFNNVYHLPASSLCKEGLGLCRAERQVKKLLLCVYFFSVISVSVTVTSSGVISVLVWVAFSLFLLGKREAILSTRSGTMLTILSPESGLDTT